MKIRELVLKDFRGYEDLRLEFGDFTCLVGPNGIGKTTILESISLLCSSLDFTDRAAHPLAQNIAAQARLKQYLIKNIRNINEEGECSGFYAKGLFEHDGKSYEVEINQDGWVKNELVNQPFWWSGICYSTRFDVDMANFQLRAELWDKFKKTWDAITAFPALSPEYMDIQKHKYVIGFKMDKPGGAVQCRKGSAGERKIMKALTQIVNLENERQPAIILADNIEMHVHYKRHLVMIDELKALFVNKQIISTTHSLPIIEKYEPKEDLVDIETILSKHDLP